MNLKNTTLNLITISFIIVFFLTTGLATSGETMNQENSKFQSFKEVPSEAWQKLSEKILYFGHQSVGYNIMDGVEKILKEKSSIVLNVVDTFDPDSLKPGIFAHSRLGYNRYPESKTDWFSFLMKSGLGIKADYAFHKYCYVDMTSKSDVGKIFAHYKKTIVEIKNRNQKARIIHITIPLSTIESGIKAKVKKILGRSLARVDSNINRNKFNDMLLQEYGGKDLIFNLAALQSTFPDGSISFFEKDGQRYYSLVPGYASDSGHLNDLGRRYIAEQLLLFLVNVVYYEVAGE